MTDQTNEPAIVEQTPNASSAASDASSSVPVTDSAVDDTATTDEADVPESESLLESVEHVIEDGIEALKKLVE